MPRGYRGGKKICFCTQCGAELLRFPSHVREINFCNKICKGEHQRQDLTGKEFGLLTVIERGARDKYNHIRWRCLCKCTGKKLVSTGALLGGYVKSCGCRRFRTGEDNSNWNGGKISVSCSNPSCDKTKLIYPSHKNLYKRFYCSSKCLGEHTFATGERRGENSPRYKGKIRVDCAYCGNGLEVFPSQAVTYEKHFCKGGECLAKWCANNYKGGNDPNFRGGTPEMRKIRCRISAAMRKAIRQKKAGRRWESLVEYNMADLINRLKSTIPEGYSWEKDFIDGKGVLHIDHVKPMSFFSFAEAEDEEFRTCFALDNLQLLPAIENMRKSGKLNWTASRY